MRQPWNTIHAPHAPRFGRQPAAVGATIWQTPGGVQDELGVINGDFDLFAREFDQAIAHLGPRPFTDARSQALADFHDHVWVPLLAAWQAWYGENHSWWGNLWWNHAPTAEQYQKKLVDIRAQAQRLGMNVTSPAPSGFSPSVLFDPTHNLIDDAADAARKAGDGLKIAALAAVGLGGLLILSRGRSG